MRLKVPVCLLFSAALGFAASPAWELAPPDAKILIGADVRGLRNSSLTDSVPPENRSQMTAALTLLHIPGMELLNDIDSVFLASSGESAGAPAATPKLLNAKAGAVPASPGPAFLLILDGTFPEAHLRPFLKGAHPTYKGVMVYRGTGPNSFSFAALDEHTVLIGDDKSLYRAIDRKILGVKAGGPLLTRARELAASNDIWLVAQDAAGALRKASPPNATLGSQIWASEIDGLEFGVATRAGFNMDFTVTTKTEAGAQAITQLLMAQMQAAVNSKLDSTKAQDFWRKVKVGTEGKRMEMQIALTKEELQKNVEMMRELRASGTSGKGSTGGAASAARPVAAAPPPKPAGPRVIKIYGLDDGVKEIKLDPQN